MTKNGQGTSAVLEKKISRIRPLQQWVLIRKVEREETTTQAGVVLVAGGRSQRGIVVAVPKEVPLNEGDMVIFTNFPIELEDIEEVTGEKNLKLVRYEEVYAVIEPCQ